MKLKVNELKKQLKQYDQKDLIQLVVELSKISKDTENYLASKFLGDEAVEELFSNCQRRILNEFFPDRGHGKLRFAVAKKEINTFKKTTGDKKRTCDLMLYFVELGVDFTNTYGDIDAPFYNNIGNMYAKVVSICDAEDEFFYAFAERLEKVVNDSADIGWGFHDNLCNCYYSLHLIDEEDED